MLATLPGIPTEELILDAFLALVRERGYDGATTRAVAAEAGVNEVTIFRRFGDKASLARAAMGRVDATPLLDAYQPRIDPSSPVRAAEGILRCLLFVRETLLARPEAVLPPPHPELAKPATATARATRGLLERTLSEARLQLRPEVDLRSAAVALQALVCMTVLWQAGPGPRLSVREWDRLIENVLRPLIKAG